ncbi:hypothetical protein [Bradyrhizobium sp. McL0615]|uniref:hypothetical protein n=1 Tax=Bradyrhizobium sp. McL0615 TaxID=3415673 RepID=UPI003CF95523
MAQRQAAHEALMLCIGKASPLARIAFMTAFTRNAVIPFNTDDKKHHLGGAEIE